MSDFKIVNDKNGEYLKAFDEKPNGFLASVEGFTGYFLKENGWKRAEVEMKVGDFVKIKSYIACFREFRDTVFEISSIDDEHLGGTSAKLKPTQEFVDKHPILSELCSHPRIELYKLEKANQSGKPQQVKAEDFATQSQLDDLVNEIHNYKQEKPMKLEIYDESKKKEEQYFLRLARYCGRVFVVMVDENGERHDILMRFDDDGVIRLFKSVSEKYGFKLDEEGRIVIGGRGIGI